MPTKISIGLLVPPRDDWLSPDCAALYPDIQFLSRGLGIREMSARGFDDVLDVVVERSIDLKRAGVQAISIMGASLTYHGGEASNRAMIDTVTRATGLPTTSMSRGMVLSLHASKLRRVALATAYDDALNANLADFLGQHGIVSTAARGLGLRDIASVRPTPPSEVCRLAREAFEIDPSADGILISCGGLPTLSLHQELENDLKIPIVSSFPAGLWDVVQLAGQDPRVPNFGRMFETAAAEPALQSG